MQNSEMQVVCQCVAPDGGLGGRQEKRRRGEHQRFPSSSLHLCILRCSEKDETTHLKSWAGLLFLHNDSFMKTYSMFVVCLFVEPHLATLSHT